MANINNKMMINKVIKRNGKRVDFDGTKIALAIKKGFDSVTIDGVNTKYSQEDVNKIYESILENISKLQTEKIKIEEDKKKETNTINTTNEILNNTSNVTNTQNVNSNE